LKYISEETTSTGSDSSPHPEMVNSLISLTVDHASKVLTALLMLSESTSYVRPAFEELMGTYATVTLSEFASHLQSPIASFSLMEKVHRHAQLGGRVAPVSQWAHAVMARFISNMNGDLK
jgi:hypothetical protein